MMVYFIPCGKSLEIRAIVLRTFLPVASALEPGRWNTATATDGWLSR